MTKRIISLSSVTPRSGKDTIAESLAMRLRCAGIKAELVTLAAPLKKALAAHMQWTRGWEHASIHNKDGLSANFAIAHVAGSGYRDWLLETYEGDELVARSPRWHMQQFGTNYIRDHLESPDHWLDIALKSMIEDDTIYIVTDTRMPNEFDRFSAEGAVMVNIVPHGFPADHPAMANDYSDQPTENALADKLFEYNFRNHWGKPEVAREAIYQAAMNRFPQVFTKAWS